MKEDVHKEIEEFNEKIDKYYSEKRVLYLDDQAFYISSILDNSVTLSFLKYSNFYTAIIGVEDFISENHLFTTNYNGAQSSFNNFYQQISERAKATGMSLVYDKTTSIRMDRLSLFNNAHKNLHTTSVNFYGEFLDQ